VQLDIVITDAAASVKGWTLTRNDPARAAVVWTGTSAVLAASVVDYTAPFNVPVTYTLTVLLTSGATSVVVSNAVTVPGFDCWLTNPVDGTSLSVMLVTWPTRLWEPRTGILDVLNRADPVALIDEHRTPAGVWNLYTSTDIESDALTAMLRARSPISLRVGPGRSVKSVTVIVGRFGEQRYTDAGDDERRMFAVEVQEVLQVPGVLPLGATLGGLSTLVPGTLADLAAFRPTLLAISQVPTP
jgi:hypothetical protein